MLPPSLRAMRLFQIGIISKNPQSFLSVQPYSNPPIKVSLGLDWKLVILERKASTDYSSAAITETASPRSRTSLVMARADRPSGPFYGHSALDLKAAASPSSIVLF